jgi:hypothetical protein
VHTLSLGLSHCGATETECAREKMLKSTLGTERKEVKRCLERVTKLGSHDLSSNVIGTMNSREVGLESHLARVGQKINVYGVEGGGI